MRGEEGDGKKERRKGGEGEKENEGKGRNTIKYWMRACVCVIFGVPYITHTFSLTPL